MGKGQHIERFLNFFVQVNVFAGSGVLFNTEGSRFMQVLAGKECGIHLFGMEPVIAVTERFLIPYRQEKCSKPQACKKSLYKTLLQFYF